MPSLPNLRKSKSPSSNGSAARPKEAPPEEAPAPKTAAAPTAPAQSAGTAGPHPTSLSITTTPEDDELPPPPPTPTATTPMASKTLKSAQVWDVLSPPPVNSVKGHILPGALKKYHRRRRISVEVHRVMPALTRDDEEEKEREGSPSRRGNTAVLAPSDPEPSVRSDADTTRDTTRSLLMSVTGALGMSQKMAENVDEYEQCFIRILVPASSKAAKKAKKGVKKSVAAVGAVMQLKKDNSSENNSAISNGDEEGEDDDHSLLGGGIYDDDTAGSVQPGSEWVPKYKLPLRHVGVNKRVKNCCVVTTQYKSFDQTREVIFNTEKEAIAFEAEIKKQKGMQIHRDRMRYKAALGGIKLAKDEHVTLLIEVVSGIDLPAADFTSSDPYVRVTFEGKEVHRTKHISKTLEPVWTLKTDAFFLLSMPAKELFECHEGLTFEVKDFDKFGKNDSLGGFVVRPKTLYLGKGERLDYKLHPMLGEKDFGKGTITIRCRHATAYDKEFLESYKAEMRNKQSDLLGLNQAMAKVVNTSGGKSGVRSVVTRNAKVEKSGPDEGEKKYRVRPFADPKRKEETAWMTKKQINDEVLKESHEWLDVGSGKLGRIFLEVIGCDGLPNLDTGGFLGNKTDAFVSIVYEDCVAKTDVIDDSLAPRWLPWSQRAFVFHMMHSSSQLFLGVFDFDPGFHDDHDLIGRVSVDMSNFQPDTVYFLHYDIFPSAKMSGRKARGTITIRLRMEIPDQRKLLISNLEPPPVVHVNVKKKKDFKVVRYTCTGKYNMEKYSMKTINAYIEELIAYQQLLYYVEDALLTLLLWRGHFKVTIRVPKLPWKKEEDPGVNFDEDDEDDDFDSENASFWRRHSRNLTVLLPVHSMNAFILGIFLVERPTLLPSFFFGWIAWLLLAVVGWRRHNPSPWNRCKSFHEFVQVLALGESMQPPHTIDAYENAEETAEFNEKWQERVRLAEEEAERQNAQYLKEQEELEKEMEEIGETDVDISTKTGGGPSIDPFKPILFPIQQYLATICDWLRFSKNVVIWEECYFAFWITAGSLVLAVSFLFVPWAFLVRWTSRLVVWTIFGPWMKLVDVYYVSKMKPLSEDEREKQEREAKMVRQAATQAAATEARIKREEAAKLKDFKQHMFGRFITKVPILKLDRYRDVPKPESTATPYKPDPVGMADLAMREAGRNRTRVTGQHLVGEMIPQIESTPVTEAPRGQPTARKSLLDENSPGAKITQDSDFAAYAKIASVVIGGLVATYFGVPLVVSSIRWVSGSFRGGASDLWEAARSWHSSIRDTL